MKGGVFMRYEYCPKCGGKLSINKTKDKNRPKCIECDFIFYQNPIVGVASIIIKDNLILLGKRKSSYKGKWCIPCGYVEWDEDVYDSLKRETFEETGLIIKNIEAFNVLSNFHNPNQHTVGIWFIVDVESGILTPGDDLEDVKYFSYNSLPELAFPTDIIILEELYKRGMII